MLLLVGTFVAFQVGREVYASWSISQEADRVRAEIAAMAEENTELQRELDYLRSDAYISAEARKLLNLGCVERAGADHPAGRRGGAAAGAADDDRSHPPLLEQWLALFFGS